MTQTDHKDPVTLDPFFTLHGHQSHVKAMTISSIMMRFVLFSHGLFSRLEKDIWGKNVLETEVTCFDVKKQPV